GTRAPGRRTRRAGAGRHRAGRSQARSQRIGRQRNPHRRPQCPPAPPPRRVKEPAMNTVEENPDFTRISPIVAKTEEEAAMEKSPATNDRPPSPRGEGRGEGDKNIHSNARTRPTSPTDAPANAPAAPTAHAPALPTIHTDALDREMAAASARLQS